MMDKVVVTAAVIQQKNKYFIAQRKKGKSHELLWEFPGGKVEQNETPKFCLARELKEEFNIVTSVKEFLLETSHDYGTININLKTYNVEILEGDIELHEHEKIEWVTLDEMKNYNFIAADYKIIDYLKNIH
jgi:8-oxo-dGTP diphosphatase